MVLVDIVWTFGVKKGMLLQKQDPSEASDIGGGWGGLRCNTTFTKNLLNQKRNLKSILYLDTGGI